MTVRPLNLFEYELLAREGLNLAIYDYYASGANDEVTLRENRAVYERIRLRPRMLQGNGQRDLTTTVLGQSMSAPILIAPMAFMKMGHPEGELAVARAAAKQGVTMVVSTSATYTLEDIAQSAPEGKRWFQLYMDKDRKVARALVERAEAAGYQALVLTVDRPLLGRREADLRNEFRLLPGLELANYRQASTEAYESQYIDDNLSWKDVDWLRSITHMPLLVKGILRGDDACLALEHGAAGIIVSNHGGRQLDTVPSAIEVLPEIVAAVEGKVEVLVDGGIRRGTDIIKALALGAKAVLLGRPVLWGLAVDGEAGVSHVLDLLIAEFDLVMSLCGCKSVAEVTEDLIFRGKY